jgi:hypothetical protein
MTEHSDFEFLMNMLKASQPLAAKEIAKNARLAKRDWKRSDANSVLYRMLRRGLVRKIEVDGEAAPRWTIPTSGNDVAETLPKSNMKGSLPIQRDIPLVSLPLRRDSSLTLIIQGVEIQFAPDETMNEYDPYMHGDWLSDKIFVSLNLNHPFWTAFVTDEDRLALYATLIAQEVFVQWQVARRISPISPTSLHSLRDLAMRDIAIHSRASRDANAD